MRSRLNTFLFSHNTKIAEEANASCPQPSDRRGRHRSGHCILALTRSCRAKLLCLWGKTSHLLTLQVHRRYSSQTFLFPRGRKLLVRCSMVYFRRRYARVDIPFLEISDRRCETISR